MNKKILKLLLLITGCKMTTAPKRIKLSEEKKISPQETPKSASFFCVLRDLSDLFLHIDNGVLEKLDFEQTLSTYLQEQLIIYDLFSKFFLLIEYKENENLRKIIHNIARSFNLKGDVCYITKTYNKFMNKEFRSIHAKFETIVLNAVRNHELCLVTKDQEKIRFNLKEGSTSDDNNYKILVGLTCEYYRNGFYKKLNITGDNFYSLKNEIKTSLMDPKKVQFIGEKITSLALENLTNLCFYNYFHHLSLASDHTKRAVLRKKQKNN